MDDKNLIGGTFDSGDDANKTNETVNEPAGFASEELEGTLHTSEKLAEEVSEANIYADIENSVTPPASKKTTVVLVSIIVVLVAVIAFFAVMFAKKYAEGKKQNPDGNNSAVVSGTVDSNDSNSTSSLVSDPVNYEAKEYNVTVQLGQYVGVEGEYSPEEVTEEAIDEEIEYTLHDYAEPIDITDRPVQEGDVANIDYTGYINDVAFDGGADTGYDLEIGAGTFINGFEAGLIGHNVGETVDVEVTFPEDYGVDSLNGQPALFVVVINSITAYEYPELNDEFVLENFDYATVEEYRASIREELEAYAAEDAESAAEAAIFDKIIENTTFGGDIEEEIADYAQQYKDYYDSMASAYYGVDGATLFNLMYGLTAEEYDEMITEQSEYSIKYGYVLDKIAEVEGFTVSEEEYDEEFESIFFDYYGYTSKEEVLADAPQEQIDKTVNSTVLRNKAEAFVIDNAIINK